jgi:hypothetical protein
VNQETASERGTQVSCPSFARGEGLDGTIAEQQRIAQMESPEHEKQAITRYVLSQSPEDTEVEHAEKMASQRVMGTKYDIWDVRTNDGRWWIITSPTNLYSQDDFQSMDFALTFHTGLTMRVWSKDRPDVGDEEEGRARGAWRRWTQAAEALQEAEEAEAFQAVGMRCRESLLSFVRGVGTDEMVPDGETPPKKGSFVQWSEVIANAVAAGSRSDRLSALKSVAQSTWELGGWLTHSANATRYDAEFVLDATKHALAAYTIALVRQEREAPDRCPVCSSYRLARDYRPEIEAYAVLCGVCGWEDVPTDE